MSNKFYPNSGVPIRRTVDLLPVVFQTSANEKFLSGVLDPLVQPGVLDKVVGYAGRKYDKTYTGADVYVDSDNTLRSRYQLEPGVVYKSQDTVENFYDYIDLKNQLKFFGNVDDRDDNITNQEHYTWNPPVDWDKFINYREYYWEPSGPRSIVISGQSTKITSTYKVALGTTDNSFVLTPDSFTNNPTLTLYRGQTYKFKVNAPGQGFSIRTNYDTGSLIFQPYKSYSAGDLVVSDNKLWRAKVDVSPLDGSSITIDSQDWQYIEPASAGTALEYSKGITNNGIENGTLTFKVPFDAPDTLYYQSLITPDMFGRLLISNIEDNTAINVEQELVGKSTYTSSNGVTLSNGMVLEFRGTVTPSKYATDTWLVEGVGEAITLTRFTDLVVPVLTTDVPEVLFDNEGFDTQPFDDAAAYPTYKDYITIKRDSRDSNPWSRYNRWFHRSVLEQAYSLRGEDFPATESLRAKRPIIEFKSNLQLFNHGSIAKPTVDYIDTFTTDIFSNIEGSAGYNIDGEFLFEGARVLIVSDTDNLANNKIYEVSFITFKNTRQIHLKESVDAESILGEGVLVRRGVVNGGKMFHFNGSRWIESQTKTGVNQPPRFDAYDANGVSFTDTVTYPTSTFAGTEILGYKLGNSVVDTELGFSISYLNINNIGDIQFNWMWDTESFNYTVNRLLQTKNLNTGFYKFNNIASDEYSNGWTHLSQDFIQPIIDSQLVKSVTNTLTFKTVIWDNIIADPIINFYVNGIKYLGTWSRNSGTFTFDTDFSVNDAVSIKLIGSIVPEEGYYEIPVGLEKNPLNDTLQSFTLGQAIDHLTTALEFNTDIDGIIPGNSNLKDLSGYQQYSKRFLKHSGLTPVTMMTLCDKTHNVIKSLQYARKAYSDFKNNFLARSLEIDFNDNIVDFTDDIINSLTKTKNVDSPFAGSDMLGAGAYTAINYTVEDTGIITYALSAKFDLVTLSTRTVYVYHNGLQLLNTRDYTFNSTFGFVQLLITLAEGDQVEIREYVSTATNYIPPTPTSMGLYKKYTPMKFVDDTFVEPREVIQGHDGSISTTFGDFRDQLLLELEYRIYNNIKQDYNETIFNIDDIVGGYTGVGVYKKSQLDVIVNQEFLKWIQNTNINYTLNTYFDSQDSFTYTYSRMADPTKTISLPGYWRGVYTWFYDTDRPHRCPWEMLGFSQQPVWWEAEYGAAPYTSGNLILWEDLAAGIVRQGTRAGIYDRYKRPTLLSHIPVDSDGMLLSPLDSGLAQNFSLINNQGSFAFGDIGPAEHAWRSSSEWPFAVTLAMCLLKPFEFISDSFDRSRVSLNILGQTIHSDTETFIELADFAIHKNDLSVGLVKYIIDYVKSRGINSNTLWDKISNLDVALSYRMSGFVDQSQQKFLLDSKNPNATSSSIFVPQENYDIIFNVSSPIANITYSGVILEKTNGGWVINGYDDVLPYFNYFQAMSNQRDPLISVGGVSESFLDWAEGKIYNNGILVRNNNTFYRALKSHTSSTVFDETLWKKLAGVPQVGAVEAFRRKTFNTLSVKKLSYGTQFTNIQQVVDFLLGYEAYLKNVGFTFDNYDPENKVSQDWLSAGKEFMFWTKHNWQVGALISISPAAQKVNITVPVGVADSILDGFYNYQVLKGDGKPLQPQFIDVNREFQTITVTTTNTTDGIYYLKLYYVLKEHVTIFDDRTVFNDIIYDKTTGYRQGRIKVQGFRTTDWDGDYTSPGFLFDNVNIQTWLPYIDYKLGDIVAYRSYNWTSLTNQLGTETFDDTFWTKLDTTPKKQLVANFDYKIKGFADYFEVTSDGLDKSNRDLARHTIGYQTRTYLQNLSSDSVTQFQLYQGFIREKGTANAITKIFGKLSRSGSDSIVLNEEWAFLVGRLGGTAEISEIEIQLEKNKLRLNPQSLLLESAVVSNVTDQDYRITNADFTISPIPYSTNVNPVSTNAEPMMTAGYVSTNDYDHVIATRSELTTLDITTVNDNDHIWVTFDKDSWTVLRVNESATVSVTDVSRVSDTLVEVTLNRPHSLEINDYVGFRELTNLIGFYQIVEVTNTTITVAVDAAIEDPVIDFSSTINLQLLSESRFSDYESLDTATIALLKNKSRLFVDNNGSDLWEIVEKNNVYSSKLISDYGTTTPLNAGKKVIYDNINKQVISSIPGSGFVTVYVETDTGLQLKQIVSPPVGLFAAALGSFGDAMAITPDGEYLIVGAPLASSVLTNYQGKWGSDVSYAQDDIVLYQGRLWKALSPNDSDGSTTSAINTNDWELATNIPVLSDGRDGGSLNQGMISVYQYVNGRYTNTAAFASPRPADLEKFGSEITAGFDGINYFLAVSAIGSQNNSGRVYLFKNSGSGWNHMENPQYRGVYNIAENYYTGDIVWQASTDPIAEGVRGNLWQAVADQFGDGSTLTIETMDWLKVSEISTNNSLPTNIALEDDNSTLAFGITGILSSTQMAELIKQEDQFGFSMAMSHDASILVIGAPNSDGQYFTNYRGVWRPDVEYVEGEVVKYSDPTTADLDQYYRLGDVELGVDSTYRSVNEDPSDSANWQVVGDSTTTSSGKIYVYKKTSYDLYELTQMINAGSISSFSDIDASLVVSTGDQFGFAMDITANGNTLVVSSPKADINYQNQGSVYVMSLDSATTEFRVQQKLESFELHPAEYFGYGVSISPDGAKVAVGARNAYTTYGVNFDMLLGTIFDQARTSFYADQGYTGGVYVFDKKDQVFFLTEKLEDVFSPNESFGYSVDCVGSVIVVGSPFYRPPQIHAPGVCVFEGPYVGNVRLFKKAADIDSWSITAQQRPVVDLRTIKSIQLYDNVNNIKIQDIDYVDPAKGKILNIAEQEIKFKTAYDPAVYTIGSDEAVVDPIVNWLEKNVGQLWWNTGTSKWIHAEQGDLAYRLGNWNQLVQGGSVDVYEWIETVLLPSEWATIADTNEGLAQGISGQPLYPNDDTYSIKQLFSTATGTVTQTLYYYWVKNKAVTPSNMPSRNRSAAEVANLIASPAGTGTAFIALVASDKFLAYNFDSIIRSSTALLNFKYKTDITNSIPVHSEYQLLSEGVASSLPTKKLEDKWIDSLVGFDATGNRVPASNLPAKQKYGVSFRPRQSMFVDRTAALKITINKINSVLAQRPFAAGINFANLNLVDTAPAAVLNLYDVVVDTELDLQNVGTVRTKRAILSANLVNGELDTIDIVDSGFGYKVIPPVIISGNGVGATATATLDNQGRIISIAVTARGKKYSTISATVRYFSVLVNSDSTINNFWSVYAWDDIRRVFFRSQSQAFDTTRYWSYIDWWQTGYSKDTRVTRELLSIFDVVLYTILPGDLIRIKDFRDGGWAVFEKKSNTINPLLVANISETFLDQFTQVGRENGTIQLNASLYDTTILGIGFDNTKAFDDTGYDVNNSAELRNIFKAVKEDIFTSNNGDYSVEWNKLFFTSMRYILSEQTYVDWMFKTSFLNATHNVGELAIPPNYRNDNLSNYQDYINEVKPYRTTVREYVSRYTTLETYGSALTDFDLPATYSTADGKVVPITADRSELDSYPWKWWTDNNSYSIVEITVYDQGTQYTTPPTVLITGNGTGATAQAYISNGKVSGIVVLTSGTGYTFAPVITLVGGNPSGATTAKAVSIIGNTAVRTFNVGVKFDRITKDGIYNSYTQSETFTANGLTSVFELSYAPTRNKINISITKNNQLVLNGDYTLTLYYSTSDSYLLLRGKIIFNAAPVAGDIITVLYDKNIELLDAVNRIDQNYNPTSGMIGKELNQLMTGIDFGGVQIQGTTFDVTGGWDALPWFTDNWDSVEASSDYYNVCDGSTRVVTLPYVPAAGQELNIYIKRAGQTASTRIDDPNYTDAWDSTSAINPNAQMPTFIGNGVTSDVEIGQYIQTNVGDTLIFRPIESDGSVTITDEQLLDTQISGGTLSSIDSAYITATGAAAEDITINGGTFTSPAYVPAPEENVPGQVLDSVSIKVYNNTVSGSATLQSKISESNGVDTVYTIGQQVLENNSVLVYVDKIKQIDYILDLENYNVEFNSSPVYGSIIEILSVGIGGLGILDYQEFVADGTTNLFLTNANFDYTSSIFVTVNGEQLDTGFTNSTDVVDAVGRTLVQFGFTPELGDIIKIVCFEAASDVDSSGVPIVNINTQTVYFEGSTRSFDLTNFVNLSRGSARNSMIVEVAGTVLKGSDTTYTIYDGTNNVFTLGLYPFETPGSILPSNIRVFINNIDAAFITDYVFDGPTKILTIYPNKLTVGDIIKIQNDLRAEYSVVDSNLVIADSVDIISVDELSNTEVNITWFGEYPSLDIVSDERAGGRVQYQLSRTPISASYVWVYKNGHRLTQDIDYYVSLPRGVVYLNVDTTAEDDIKTLSFSRQIFKLPSAYEIHKDMLNVYHFNRFAKGEIKLASTLNYYDTTLTVDNADTLSDPIASRNIPGVVWISSERIEYMTKVGNVLGQLRRGTQGSPIGEVYNVNTAVVDIGPQDTIPYNETQERMDFYSDGSSVLIGPLEYVPAQGVRSGIWYRDTIPTEYGPCDQIEVFAGGRRLRKDPVDIWVEANGAYSPAADETAEAEFSVDGAAAYIRLTEPLVAGTRVTVIKRTGKTWYDRGAATASAGATLLDNTSAIAKFIAQKSTSIPE